MSRSTFDRIMRAIRNKDHSELLIDATDEMRRGVTPELMDQIYQDLAPHLEVDSEPTHLRRWEEDGFELNLWKIASRDGTDVRLRVVTRDGKLAGLWRDRDA